MDWYSWLTKSGLDPSLVYEYGLAFSRNELQKEDLSYLNHEFLQSMGISVAKHRLEILKLARKEVGSGQTRLSKLVLAINKTKKCFNKYVIKKLVHHEETAIIKPLPEPPEIGWRGGFTRKCKSEKELRVEQPMPRNYTKIAKSGPLDGRGQEKSMFANSTRSLKLSGPLDRKASEKLVFSYKSPVLSGPIDGKAQERLTFPSRSPMLSGPLYGRPPSPKICGDHNKEKEARGYGDHTLWAALFQDMKPT
ncbi:hypothetical protein SLA2020_044660 [Shorea laevis]